MTGADLPAYRSAVVLRRILYRLTLVALGAIFLNGCNTTLPEVHYRLTVVVDTPEGRRSGSGVIAFSAVYVPAFTEGLYSSAHGEAVPVKLPNGNYLFALLKWNGADDEAQPMLLRSFADLLPPSSAEFPDHKTLMKQIRALSKVRASRPVNPKYYPILAWFDDTSKPRTIHSTPAKIGKTVMRDVKLVSMTLTITTDPITHRIQSILPWLHKKDLGYLDPMITSTTPFKEQYMLVRANNFSTYPPNR